jgi:hypothetical protein
MCEQGFFASKEFVYLKATCRSTRQLVVLRVELVILSHGAPLDCRPSWDIQLIGRVFRIIRIFQDSRWGSMMGIQLP